MLVKVTAYNDILIIDGPLESDFAENEEWVPLKEGRIGCVLINTKKNLGVSQEALDLLKTVKKSRDDIGDIDWFESNKGWCFAWLGGPKRLAQTTKIDGSRNYAVPSKEHYTLIPNDIPEEVLDVLKAI